MPDTLPHSSSLLLSKRRSLPLALPPYRADLCRTSSEIFSTSCYCVVSLFFPATRIPHCAVCRPKEWRFGLAPHHRVAGVRPNLPQCDTCHLNRYPPSRTCRQGVASSLPMAILIFPPSRTSHSSESSPPSHGGAARISRPSASSTAPSLQSSCCRRCQMSASRLGSTKTRSPFSCSCRK